MQNFLTEHYAAALATVCIVVLFRIHQPTVYLVQKVSKLCPKLAKIDRNGQKLKELKNQFSRRENSVYTQLLSS